MWNILFNKLRNKAVGFLVMAAVLSSFLAGSSAAACASLALDKDGPDFAEPGETITYNLEWKAKNDPQTNIVLIDTLPAKTAFVSATGVYSISGNQIIWNYAGADAGEWGEEQVTVQVDGYTYDTDILVNRATVQSNEAGQVSAEKQTEIDARCQLSISKNANVSEVEIGGEINYTIEYENKGNGVCVGTGVILGEYLDERTTFVSATPEAPHYTAPVFPYSVMPGSLGEADYLWQWTELIPDGAHTMNVIAEVNELANGGDILTNKVCLWAENGSVDGSEPGEVCVMAETTVKVPVTPYFNLSVDKTAPATVMAGEEISYSIDWAVTGNMTADNTAVSDTLPTGVSFVSASDGGVYDAVSGTVNWDLGDVAAPANGTLTLVVSTSDLMVAGTILTNNVEVMSGDKTANDSTGTTVLNYYLTIHKTVDKAEANPGDEINYTINWEVSGNVTANNVRIFDYLPEGLSPLSADPTYDNDLVVMGTKYGAAAHTLVWNLGDVADGTTGTINLSAQMLESLAAGEVLVNDASIMTDEKSASDTATTTVTAAPYFNLNITKTADKENVAVGDEVTYTINWEVIGTAVASSTIVTDTLPAGTSLVFATPTYATTSNQIIWDLGDITANATGTLLLTLKVDSLPETGNELINQVEIKSGDKNITASAKVIVEDYALVVDKTGTAQVKPGEDITYVINYEVTGNMSAPTTTLTDTLPVGVTFKSGSGSPAVVDNTVTWELGDLPALASGTVSLMVTVDSTMAEGTELINSAVIKSNEKEATDSYKTTVSSTPYFALNIIKSAPAQVEAGENISYNINWSVAGNASATSSVVIDKLPSNASFISASGTYTYNTSTSEIVWAMGDLAAGMSGNLEVVVATSADLANGTLVSNLATFNSGSQTVTDDAITNIHKGGGGGGGGCTENCGGGGGFTPNPRVTLDYLYPVEKIVGDEYEETIKVTNAGNIVLTNIIIQIDLPETEIKFLASDIIGFSYTETDGILSFNIPAMGVGEVKTFKVVISAEKAGSNIETKINFDSQEVEASASGWENITGTIAPLPVVPPLPPTPLAEPTPEPEQKIVVSGKAAESKIVIAPASTTSKEVCAACQADESNVCEGCRTWLWLIIALLHGLGLLVYWFYVSREEIKENEDGEYYILKGNWAWVLPVLLVLTVIYLLLILVCHLAPWWILLLLIVAFYLALAAHQLMLKRAEIKFSPALPIFVTLMVLIAYLVCNSWAWWVWLIILTLYVLTLATYYLVVVKMNEKSRTYWWLSPMFMTALVFGLIMVLRLCQCQEVIK